MASAPVRGLASDVRFRDTRSDCGTRGARWSASSDRKRAASAGEPSIRSAASATASGTSSRARTPMAKPARRPACRASRNARNAGTSLTSSPSIRAPRGACSRAAARNASPLAGAPRAAVQDAPPGVAGELLVRVDRVHRGTDQHARSVDVRRRAEVEGHGRRLVLHHQPVAANGSRHVLGEPVGHERVGFGRLHDLHVEAGNPAALAAASRAPSRSCRHTWRRRSVPARQGRAPAGRRAAPRGTPSAPVSRRRARCALGMIRAPHGSSTIRLSVPSKSETTRNGRSLSSGSQRLSASRARVRRGVWSLAIRRVYGQSWGSIRGP